MKYRTPLWTVLSLLTVALATGCAYPLPGKHIDQVGPREPHFVPKRNVLPPADMLMHPGPGVGGPGPGVIGAAPLMHGPCGPGAYGMSSQVGFLRPDGMTVSWDISAPGAFDSEPLVVPGRFNFPQGAIYRLKLTSIPGRPGVELYPTIEIAPSTPRIEAFLAHSAIPVEFTEEDFDQVLTGNFVTKVIFLPDAEYQELAVAGVETLVSTRLDPGIDPIVEADRRGSIMAIIRLGNKDLQAGGGMALAGRDGPIVQASAHSPLPCGPAGCAVGSPMGMSNTPLPMGMPPAFVAGVTAPMYGMPITGTPIGLPGPPHIPLGVPAGLQRHTMVNHTHVHIPGPVEKFKIDVKQTPGLSYPKPVSHVHVKERSLTGHGHLHQPLREKFQTVPGAVGGGGEACAEACDYDAP